MSGRLVSAVFESALPAWLKPYAAAFASFAADDGTRVFPSITRISRMVGRCERSARYAVAELRRRRVLEVITPARHYQANRYCFHAAALPQKGDGDQLVLLTFPAHPQADRKNVPEKMDFHSFHRRQHAAHCTPGVQPTAPRSVIDPSIYSSYTRARAKGKYPKRETAS